MSGFLSFEALKKPHALRASSRSRTPLMQPQATRRPMAASFENQQFQYPTHWLSKTRARRRTKVIPHAFGKRAVLKLMYAALIRAAEHWRGIRITEFEQHQLKAIRDEIDNNFAARTAPATSAAVTAPQLAYAATTGLDPSTPTRPAREGVRTVKSMGRSVSDKPQQSTRETSLNRFITGISVPYLHSSLKSSLMTSRAVAEPECSISHVNDLGVIDLGFVEATKARRASAGLTSGATRFNAARRLEVTGLRQGREMR